MVLASYQVKLKVYSEEDSRNSNLLNPDDSLLTKKISVQAFGDYVEELHAHGNTGFREQFYVSGSPIWGWGLCLTTPFSCYSGCPIGKVSIW